MVIWPKEDNAEMLLAQGAANQLEWIGCYNSIRNQLSTHETATCESILKALLDRDEDLLKADYNVIADWLIGYHDDSCFDRLGYSLLQRYFQKINGESCVKLVGAYPARHCQIKIILDKIEINITQNFDTAKQFCLFVCHGKCNHWEIALWHSPEAWILPPLTEQ